MLNRSKVYRQAVYSAGTLMACMFAPSIYAQDIPTDFSGVWSLVQHDRLGAPFFIPVEPTLTPEAKAITEAFVEKYDVVTYEANAHCVEPGMPTVMWGIGGAAMEIIQKPDRVIVLSELVNQSRQIYLDGRDFPEDFPTQRVGYSIGQWDGDVLEIDTRLITEWHAPRWPHSDKMRIVERWRLQDASGIKITGLRPANPPTITGTVLVNELTISDPIFYVEDETVVTFVYRRQDDGVIFEDNCSESIWMELLEDAAANTQ
jgi:hypothetical protein